MIKIYTGDGELSVGRETAEKIPLLSEMLEEVEGDLYLPMIGWKELKIIVDYISHPNPLKIEEMVRNKELTHFVVKGCDYIGYYQLVKVVASMLRRIGVEEEYFEE